MALVRAVYSRVEHLIREVAKFGIVGGVSYVTTVLVDEAYLLIQRDEHLTAYIVANVAATGVAYLGSRYWTYRDRESAGGAREMGLFLAINGVAIAIQAGVVALTFYVLHLRSHVENFFSEFVLAIAIGMAFRFWCYRSFIFPQAAAVLPSDEFEYIEPIPTSQLGPGAPLPGTPLSDARLSANGRRGTVRGRTGSNKRDLGGHGPRSPSGHNVPRPRSSTSVRGLRHLQVSAPETRCCPCFQHHPVVCESTNAV